MTTILITNDDGIAAPCLPVLRSALLALGEVVVLAPDGNWSASGHTKTMHKPLRVHDAHLTDGSPAYSTNGGPADCTALALLGVVGAPPDLVVSGINRGYNLGHDVTYSGTVAAALEAAIHGRPGIAVSNCMDAPEDVDYVAVWQRTAQVVVHLASQVLQRGLPPYTILNVNVPCVDPQTLGEVRVTHLGERTYEQALIVRDDPWGRPYYWYGGERLDGVGASPGSDMEAVGQGKISVTPVHLDMTRHHFVDELRTWSLADNNRE